MSYTHPESGALVSNNGPLSRYQTNTAGTARRAARVSVVPSIQNREAYPGKVHVIPRLVSRFGLLQKYISIGMTTPIELAVSREKHQGPIELHVMLYLVSSIHEESGVYLIHQKSNFVCFAPRFFVKGRCKHGTGRKFVVIFFLVTLSR
jgi:hypothetical protein